MPGNPKYKIAISGKANSGKNTVANMIVNFLNLPPKDVKIVGLADPLKKIAQMMFPMAKAECLFGASELRSEVISPEYKDTNKKDLTYRQFLLDFGKFGRAYSSYTWINCLIDDMSKSKCQAYVISDVRMWNELTILQSYQFHTIKVVRDACSKIDDISEIEQDEFSAKDFDYLIDNNSNIENLSKQVENIVRNIKNITL